MLSVAAVFAFSAAIGLSLYAALAGPGIAAYFGLITLPGGLAGLGAPAVWGSLLGLLAIEIVSSRRGASDFVWSGLHTIARPLAAGLLASVGFSANSAAEWGGTAVAALIALIVHLAVMGTRVAARARAPFPGSLALTATQTMVAGALGIFVFIEPTAAGLAAWLAFVALLPLTPRLIAAASAALRAALAALWQPGRVRPTWEIGPEALPGSIRGAVEKRLGRPLEAVRSARLTLARHGEDWPFFRGRLVVVPEELPLFAHRQLLHPQVLELPPGLGRSGGEMILETLEVEAPTPYTLYVGPEAPPGAAILAAVTAREGTGDPEVDRRQRNR